ncbi:MAG: hypothetical protein ACE3JK_02650 [Sporolactobacillus sp.]
MSKFTYNINDQIQPLALKIANLEVENSRLVPSIRLRPLGSMN